MMALEAAQILSNAVVGREIKHIIILHIGGFDAFILDQLLTAFENKGAKFITLEEALKDKVYESEYEFYDAFSYSILNKLRVSRKMKNPERVAEIMASHPKAKLAKLCTN